MAKDLSYVKAQREFPAGFAPRPTVFAGGLERMVKLWNKARDQNTGGYGGNRLFQIDGWSGVGTVTSCSPFTGVITGMLFDPSANDDKAVWTPMFDQGAQPLTSMFYSMHNGNFTGGARVRWFAENHWHDAPRDYLGNKWPYAGARWVNHSANSLVWYNLGYTIDPRDMRRGDLIGIDWVSGGGHATFCWDVHLDAEGAVDCFSFLSSNSPSKVGVSVSTIPPTLVVAKANNGWRVTDAPMFENKDKYVEFGTWHCLPHLTDTAIDRTTFKTWPRHVVAKSNGGQYAVNHLWVTRLWGFPPPENPHGFLLGDNAALARQLARHTHAAPYAPGQCTKPGKGVPAQAKPVAKSHPEPKKAVAPEPTPQPKAEAVSHQLWVECALHELFVAGWIARDPGTPDAVADAKSKAAVKDFQTRFKVSGEAGHAGAQTRDALAQALADYQGGKPDPNAAQRTPKLEHFYWSPNTVEPGGAITIGVTGHDLDLVPAYNIRFTDKATGANATCAIAIAVAHGTGSTSLAVPSQFAAGAQLELLLSAAGMQKPSNVVLQIRKRAPRRAWPWDDARWPAHVRSMLTQLRGPVVRRGAIQRRQIAQYGVWDQVAEGDVPVRGARGRVFGRVDRRSLALGDLAGALWLDGKIVSLVRSGHTFDGGGEPDRARFDAAHSQWTDVSAQAPWGMGAKMPLLPFRTLAHDPRKEPSLYGRRVFVEPLAGVTLPTGEVHNGVCIVGDCGTMEGGLQFELFVGPESGRITLPAQCNVEIL